MDKVKKILQMEIYTKVNLKTIKQTAVQEPVADVEPNFKRDGEPDKRRHEGCHRERDEVPPKHSHVPEDAEWIEDDHEQGRKQFLLQLPRLQRKPIDRECAQQSPTDNGEPD